MRRSLRICLSTLHKPAVFKRLFWSFSQSDPSSLSVTLANIETICPLSVHNLPSAPCTSWKLNPVLLPSTPHHVALKPHKSRCCHDFLPGTWFIATGFYSVTCQGNIITANDWNRNNKFIKKVRPITAPGAIIGYPFFGVFGSFSSSSSSTSSSSSSSSSQQID